MTDIVQSHGEPTHPAGIAGRFGKGQGLAHLAAVAPATRAMMPLHDTCIDLLIPESVQHLVETGCAPHRPHIDPYDPTAFVDFVHVPIRPALRPPYHRTSDTACGAMARWCVTTSTHLQEGRLIAPRSVGENRWQRPGAQPAFGILDSGQRLLWGAFADDPGDAQLPIGSHRGMSPQVPSLLTLMRLPALLLFCTTLHGASNSKARGVTSRTRWSWKRSAWRPASRSKRATVSWATRTRRAVLRTPHPSSQWLMMDAAWSSALLGLNKAGPRRSEHSSPHVR
jgi:hypothetical protein